MKAKAQTELILDKVLEMGEERKPKFNFSIIEKKTSTDNIPTWIFPDKIQNIIEAVTDGYQTERDYVIASIMSATSAMTGKKASSTFGNHTNYGSLWISIVGDSSRGKTAPLSWFYKPIMNLERECHRNYREKASAWEKEEVKTRGDKPLYLHRILDNATDESVEHELAFNPYLTWKCDELRSMFESWGRYTKNGSNGGIVSRLLSVFNYEDVSITRKNAEPLYIHEPCLSIVGGIQPNRLAEIMGGGSGFTEDGMMQRFLFVFPKTGKTPLYKEKNINKTISADWESIVRTIEHMEARELSETNEALQLHIDTINRWRVECDTDYKDIDAMKALVRKLEIQLCRWAIVVSVLCDKTHIDEDVIKYSAQCMEYFKRCGEKVFMLCQKAKRQEPTRKDVFALLEKWYPDLNQSGLARSLGVSQQAVNKYIK